MTPERRWARWFEAGAVLSAHKPASAPIVEPVPWVIRVLLGACGWVAGLLLLLAVGFAWYDRLDSALGLLGVVPIALAYWLFRRARSDLGSQFALSLSLAGQGALALALSGMSLPAPWVLVSLATMQAALWWLMPDVLHRTFSAVFAVLALHWACVEAGLPSPVIAVVFWLTCRLWLDESRWRLRLGERFVPLWAGMTLALLAVTGPMSSWLTGISQLEGNLAGSIRVWVDTGLALLAGASWLLAVRRWTVGARKAQRRLAGLAGALLMLLCAWIPGVSASLLVALLAFSRGYPGGVVLALTAALVHLSWFYYSLHATLLAKSFSLLLLGLLLLLINRVLPRFWPKGGTRV